MLGSLPPSSPSRLSSVTPGYFKNVLFGLPMVAALTKGHLEKSAIERIRSQARADAGMSLNCCIPLELDYSRYLKVCYNAICLGVQTGDLL